MRVRLLVVLGTMRMLREREGEHEVGWARSPVVEVVHSNLVYVEERVGLMMVGVWECLEVCFDDVMMFYSIVY
jgi:hypothetical protein